MVALIAGVALPGILPARAVGGEFAFANAVNSAPEGAATGTPPTLLFRVTYDGSPSPVPVSVDYATSDITATAGVDYVATSGSNSDSNTQTSALTFFEADQRRGYMDLEIPLIGDAIREPDETFRLTLSRPTGGTFAGNAQTIQATGEIQNDDGSGPGPLATIVAPVAVQEPLNANSDPVAMLFTIKLDEVAGQNITVSATTANSSATAPSDYAARSSSTTPNGTVTIPKDKQEATFAVQLFGDNVVEGDETFTVTLTGASNAILGSPIQAVGTIQDNEATAISLNSITATEGDSGTSNAVMTISLSAPAAQDLNLTYSTIDGNAREPGDYTKQTNTAVTVPAGTTSKTISIPIVGDVVFEETQFFDVVLFSNTGAQLDRSTVTILDNEARPGLSIDDASLAEGNSGRTAVPFKVKMSGLSETNVTVNAATGSPAEADAATAGSDFDAFSQTVTVPRGSLESASFSVNVIGDTLYAVDERFLVNLSGPSGATLADAQAVGTIKNDDLIPVLTIADREVNEGSVGTTTPMQFTVTQTNGAESPVTFNWATKDDSAVSTGQAPPVGGRDYDGGSGNAVAINQATKVATFSVNIQGDALPEPKERFFVNLTEPKNATIPFGTATGSINNDDGNTGIPTVAIASPAPINEGNPNADGTPKTTPLNFTVTVSGASTQPITVNYKTVDGTAKSPADYTGTNSGVLTIPTGSTSGTIAVPIVGDVANEDNEQFQVVITSVGNANPETGKDSATGTINDDDATPTVSVVDKTVSEGDADTTAVVDVTLSAESADPVTVQFATSNGTATAPGDYTAVTETVTFAPGEISKSVSIPVKGDTVDEGDETVNLTISQPSSNATIGDGTGTLTIEDDDGTTPTLSINDATVTEGNSGEANLTFTVTLDPASQDTVTVQATSADGTAEEPADYTAFDETLTFAPGEKTKTVTVKVKGDTVDEPNETLTVLLSGADGATVSASGEEGTGTITDDDAPAGAPAISVSDPSTAEGNSGTKNLTFTVTLDKAGNSPIKVDYTTEAGTATAGTDYVTKAGTLTFAAGDTSETVDVVVNGDTTDESDETLKLKLSNADGASIAKDTGNGTISDDDGAAAVVGRITTGVGPGGGAHIRNYKGNEFTGDFFAFDQNGGVRVARGDIDGDGVDEIIAGAGPGGEPLVGVYPADASGNPTKNFKAVFLAYAPGFGGGVSVAAADLDGDGIDEIITGAGPGGGPHVRVFGIDSDDQGNIEILETDGFYGAPAEFRGGVNVAAASLDADNKAEIVTAHASDGAPVVRTYRFDPNTEALSEFDQAFLAYDPNFTGGLNIAAGHLDGDGKAEIVTGPARQGGPHIKVFNGAGGIINSGIMAYDPNFLGGVSVAIGDAVGDASGEVITGAGAGGGPHVRGFKGDLTPTSPEISFYGYQDIFTGGLFVSVGKS
ncbi:MAG TPA: Calx-beta domain-containing protein [Acidimicrobiales bacterium]|nr:Calx-beta domain-containing protein [Acidimicrobiales bacterium]